MDNYAKVIRCLDEGPKRERKKVLDQVEVKRLVMTAESSCTSWTQ